MKKQTFKWALVLVLIVCFAAALPGLSASADNIGELTVGQDVGRMLVYSSPLEIENLTLSSGGLPSGLNLSWDAINVYLTGQPRTAGNYSAVYAIETSEAMLDFTISCSVVEPPEPTPTPTPTPSEEIVITKHPTGEFVELGDDRDVKFVARAENYTKIVWRIVSPDTMNTVQASEAPDYFRGLEVSGLGTETLVLKHIPREMDNWCVEAQFWNGQKHVESAGAKIYLVDAEGNPISAAPTAPPVTTTNPAPVAKPADSSTGLPVDDNARTANISVQPEDVEVEPGDAHTLSVIATSPNNGSLSYQWYSAPTNDINAALPISGASDASYTIEKAEETTYYWVAVWNVKDGTRSQPIFSETAVVKVHGEPTPTPAPTPTPEPTPDRAAASTINFQLVMFSVIGLLALAALIAVVVYLRADAKHKFDDDEDDEEE